MITLWIKDGTFDFEEWVEKDDKIGYYQFTEIDGSIKITTYPQSLAEDMGPYKPRCNINLYVSDVKIGKHLLSKGVFFKPNIIPQ